MSNWNVPVQPGTANVIANVNEIPSATAAPAAASTTKIVLYWVIGIFTTITILAAVGVPLSLALTNTGPFSTQQTSTTTATTATTTTSTSTTSTTSTSSTTSTTSTTSTSTTTTTTTTSTTTPVTGCSSYTTISDATRLSSNGGGSVCDSNAFTSSTTWVRFTAPGGTMMPTSALSGNQCGTQGAGWYAGTMPSTGNTVTGTVNFAYSGNSAYHSVAIQVRNCGSYYLYGLVTMNGCNYRFCTV